MKTFKERITLKPNETLSVKDGGNFYFIHFIPYNFTNAMVYLNNVEGYSITIEINAQNVLTFRNVSDFFVK